MSWPWRLGDTRPHGWGAGRFGPLEAPNDAPRGRPLTPEEIAARRLLANAEREEAKRRMLAQWGRS